MTYYACKYAPVELLHFLGEETTLLEPQVKGCSEAESCLHPNMCSYVKGVYETVIHDSSFDKIVLTTCCDSMNRLYDSLKAQFPSAFIILLDLPRKVNHASLHLYASELERFVAEYCAYTHTTFSSFAFFSFLTALQTQQKALSAGNEGESRQTSLPKIAMMGARCNKRLYRQLHAFDVVCDSSCTSVERTIGTLDEKAVLCSYAQSLLQFLPCMRMADVTERQKWIKNLPHSLDGIVYHAIKFCDIYPYEYALIKEKLDIPILFLETDGSDDASGQLTTRIEAFEEQLQGKTMMIKMGKWKREHTQRRANQTGGKSDGKSNQKSYYLGLDSGSTSTNAVIIDEKKRLVAYSIIPTGAKASESATQARAAVLEKAGLDELCLINTVSTGYGRSGIVYSDTDVTEISCHAKGVHFLFPSVRTILDIGGQDSKAIRLNDEGQVVDFVMNDKCAAGTGRFLEMISNALNVPLDQMGALSLTSQKDLEMTSMCSVFAESEVISMVAENKDLADIIHAVHMMIAKKSLSLMKRVGLEEAYCMSGGVAKNKGVVAILSDLLSAPVQVSDEPDIVGAFGAALYALEKHTT